MLTPPYVFSETGDGITLVIALRAPHLASVTVTRHYCKVNASPNLLELDLAGGIDTAGAVVTADAGARTLTILAPKAERGVHWGRATAEGDKATLRARREDSLGEERAREAAVREAATAARSAMTRRIGDEQAAEGARRRAALAEAQAQEKSAAVARLFGDACAEQPPRPTPSVVAAGGDAAGRYTTGAATAARTTTTTASFSVGFTTRAFPTPLRASRRDSEAAWLAARSIGDGARRPTVHPWDLDRAEQLLAHGDAASAVAALACCNVTGGRGSMAAAQEGDVNDAARRRAAALRAAARFTLGEYRTAAADAVDALAPAPPPAATPPAVSGGGPSPPAQRNHHPLCILGAAAAIHAVAAGQMSAGESRSAVAQLLGRVAGGGADLQRKVVDDAISALESKAAADAAARAGSAEEALHAYRALVDAHPSCAGAHANLAAVALMLDDKGQRVVMRDGGGAESSRPRDTAGDDAAGDSARLSPPGVHAALAGALTAADIAHAAADSAVALTAGAARWSVRTAVRAGVCDVVSAGPADAAVPVGGGLCGDELCGGEGEDDCAVLLLATPLVPVRDSALWLRVRSAALLHRAEATLRLYRCRCTAGAVGAPEGGGAQRAGSLAAGIADAREALALEPGCEAAIELLGRLDSPAAGSCE